MPERIGKYLIQRKIGSGGMAVVYAALQESPKRVVALKVMRPGIAASSTARRFRRESEILARLRHPHIAQIFDAGMWDDGAGGMPYFVMEYIPDAAPLDEFCNARKLELRDRLKLFVKVCAGVQHGHLQGIVHRDLKPENIFVTMQGGIRDFPKVLDFGLAKVTQREMRPGSVILTQEGMVFGTPEFMSPEQAQGKTLDPRSDVYSLAVILYELVTGKLPFDARSPMEYITLHVQAKPIPLAQRAPDKVFPQGFQEVLDRAMAKDPDERFQSAAEFAAALSALVPEEGVLQAMSAVPSYSAGLAPTQPSGVALRSERPPPMNPAAAPSPNAVAPTPSPGSGAINTGPTVANAPQVSDPRPVAPAPREGLPVAALIAIGVVIGLGVALVMVQLFFRG